MRLTLRTLLAYLDEVLTPEEAVELKHRIDESEFASTLVQRIRHTLRRLRLGAPKVDARGLGFDANSVAEYLDSTMPAERVVDFEKVCLESDVHLAEVAACHQILAKVLSEPAHIPDHLYERVNGLFEHARRDVAEAPPVHADNGKVAAEPEPPPAAEEAAEPPPPPVERARPEVPEYLRPEPKRSNEAWYLLPLGLLALVALAFFLPPLNQYNPLLKQREVAQNTSDDTSNTAAVNADKKTRPDDENEKAAQNKKAAEAKTPADEQPVLDKPVDEPKEATEPAPPAPKSETEEPPVDPDTAVAKADVKPATEPLPPPPPPLKSAPDVEPATPAAGVELGRYISDETVLAAYDPDERVWMRIPARSLIVDGERCLSLPVYRPQVALASGAQITIVGEASFTFSRDVDQDAPLLMVDTGKLLLHSIALPRVKTALDLNGIRGTLILDSPESEAAIEVYSYLPPGIDPLDEDEESPGSYTIASIMCVNGSCTWQQEEGEPEKIDANFVHLLVAGEEARKQGPVEPPAWINVSNISTLERDAAEIVEPLLPTDRPLDLALEELATHRRLDVRVHVARSLAFLGNYDVLIRHLSEEAYRSYWFRPGGYVDMLRKQLARGGPSAERLREELVESRGERDGKVLYRMLQGYSDQQLVAGADDALVRQLSHPNMDIRVLAIDNLNRITGAMHLYNASLSPEKSRSRILKWEELLEKGEIRYADKPSPLVEFRSLEDKEATEK